MLRRVCLLVVGRGAEAAGSGSGVQWTTPSTACIDAQRSSVAGVEKDRGSFTGQMLAANSARTKNRCVVPPLAGGCAISRAFRVVVRNPRPAPERHHNPVTLPGGRQRSADG